VAANGVKGRALAAAAAICGLLAFAPAAPAKNVSYSGPVDQPQAATYVEPPRIEFGVRFAKNDRGKLVAKFLTKLTAWNLWYQCSNIPPGSGNTSGIVYPGAINDTQSKVILGLPPRVKHGRFSATDPDEGIEVSGTIPKHGPASGTVRIFATSEPGDEPDLGTCDSGLLNWTAQ
jgi:hypothetical protein